MDLALRVLIRTPASEKLALFDLGERGANGKPINFGLLHLHYLPDEVCGTLVLAPAYWQRAVQRLPAQAQADPLAYLGGGGGSDPTTGPTAAQEAALIGMVDELMADICATIGVASACRVRVCFAPPEGRRFITNSPHLAALDQPDAPPANDDEARRPRTLWGG